MRICLYFVLVSGDILFEARETKLCSYQFDTEGDIGTASCFLENLSFTVGVEVDVADRLLFFSDINEGTMRRVNIADGVQEVEQIFHGLGSVEGWFLNSILLSLDSQIIPSFIGRSPELLYFSLQAAPL